VNSKTGSEGETFRAVAPDGRVLDYRVGQDLNLAEVTRFFSDKYTVKQIWAEKRHVVGALEASGREYFLKVSTSEGISEVTKNEYAWNEAFNEAVSRSSSDLWVPQNYDSGNYQENLFYIVTDKFEGEKLIRYPEETTEDNHGLFTQNIERVIDFSELIQSLDIKLNPPHLFEGKTYTERFLNQSRGWYNDLPEDVRGKYDLDELWQIVEKGTPRLNPKPCHGDFTPWHIIALPEGKLGLIDGEHAKSETVEGYDIGYLIQRVFTVMQNQDLAERIMDSLTKRGHGLEKIKVILAARAIGGFLDANLDIFSPDFTYPKLFKDWLLKA